MRFPSPFPVPNALQGWNPSGHRERRVDNDPRGMANHFTGEPADHVLCHVPGHEEEVLMHESRRRIVPRNEIGARLRTPDEKRVVGSRGPVEVFHHRLEGVQPGRGQGRPCAHDIPICDPANGQRANEYRNGHTACREDALRRTAQVVGEWPRVKREIWPVVSGLPLSVRVRAAMDERDPEMIRSLAGEVRDTDEGAVLVWVALGELDPERALDLLVDGVRSALADGGRAARRRAREFMRGAGRLCRARGWEDRWTTCRRTLTEEFPSAVNWPDLGALLGPTGAGDAPV